MGEHVVLDIERLASSQSEKNASSSLVPGNHQNHHEHHHTSQQQIHKQHLHHDFPKPTKSAPNSVIVAEECRICQEEDDAGNLEIPCACCGSLKYAHRKCVQRWCNEKGDTICEICQQPFKSGYTTQARHTQHTHTQQAPPNDHLRTTEWGHQLDFHDPRILAMAAERHFLQEYDDYAAANASGAACCRSAALILMALLLLRHTLAIGATGSSTEDASTFFTLFFLRAAGFLLPCYIMARAMNMLQRRRQRQEWGSSRSFQILDSSQTQRVPFINLLARA